MNAGTDSAWQGQHSESQVHHSALRQSSISMFSVDNNSELGDNESVRDLNLIISEGALSKKGNASKLLNLYISIHFERMMREYTVP